MVMVRCTGSPQTDHGQSLVGSHLAHRGQVYSADVHVRRVVVRPPAVNGPLARSLPLRGGVAAADRGYNQCSRQPYCQLSHQAVAVDHHCPHKAKAVLCPLVATQTCEKILCPMPVLSHPLQKVGNHQERLDCANEMQVPSIPEWLKPKMDEINDVSSFGDVFQSLGGDYQRSSCDHPPQLSVKTCRGGGGVAGEGRGGGVPVGVRGGVPTRGQGGASSQG